MSKAVIFDMDGTLFDSEKLVIKCWEIVAKKYNIANIKDVCMKCLGLNAKVTTGIFLDFYGQDFPYGEYKKEMSDLFHKKAAEGELLLKPGVVELLDDLKQEGYLLAVASSTREEVVLKELAMTGILDYFHQVVGGNRVERSKPEPDIFLLAAANLGVEAKECIVIEDSYNGIRAAHRAGMRPIMVPDLVPADQEMSTLSEIVLPSLHEVKEYISNQKEVVK